MSNFVTPLNKSSESLFLFTVAIRTMGFIDEFKITKNELTNLDCCCTVLEYILRQKCCPPPLNLINPKVLHVLRIISLLFQISWFDAH